MDQNDMKPQQDLLVESESKLMDALRVQHRLINAVNNRMSGFQDYLGSYREVFSANQEVFASIKGLLEHQLEMFKDVEQSLRAVEKAFAESNVTINENTEQPKNCWQRWKPI